MNLGNVKVDNGCGSPKTEHNLRTSFVIESTYRPMVSGVLDRIRVLAFAGSEREGTSVHEWIPESRKGFIGRSGSSVE